MDLTELWIGDLLRIKNSGKNGTFEGIGKEGKARIKCQGKILLVKFDALEIIDETEAEFPEPVVKPRTELSPKSYSNVEFANHIDLHIEKLNGILENTHAQIILDHQLLKCREFLSDAILRRKNVVTIIHGKGMGVLKQEVLDVVKEYKNVRFVVEVNNGGAQEIWMRY